MCEDEDADIRMERLANYEIQGQTLGITRHLSDYIVESMSANPT